VQNGFLFYSVYERTEIGEIRVPYPRSMQEAREFVLGNKRQAGPAGVASQREILSFTASVK
jgi:hypothetical protein